MHVPATRSNRGARLLFGRPSSQFKRARLRVHRRSTAAAARIECAAAAVLCIGGRTAHIVRGVRGVAAIA
jgi:hypothetical protein